LHQCVNLKVKLHWSTFYQPYAGKRLKSFGTLVADFRGRFSSFPAKRKREGNHRGGKRNRKKEHSGVFDKQINN